MAVYERSTIVGAPLDSVWAFHSTVDGLVALTPDWLDLRVESVVGPDGEADPDVLEAGSRVRLSIAPIGVGPRTSWTSRIVDRERRNGVAVFRDVMVDGPFRTWEHTHRFEAVEGGTRVTDRVEYEVPLVGELSGVARLFLEPMFAHRHRRTRARFGSTEGFAAIVPF